MPAFLRLATASIMAVAVLGVPVVAATVWLDHQPASLKNVLACSGPVDTSLRVLVVGDSWASEQRLDGPLSQNARVCSVSYSGRTAREIIQSFQSDAALQAEVAALAPQHAVLVVGVNDVMQHRGATAYAGAVRDLAEALTRLGASVRLLELPWTSNGAPRPFPSMAKAAFYSCMFDGCRSEVTTEYRAAIGAELAVVDYDTFAPAYDPADFKPDGVHLTDPRREDLARLIADSFSP